MCVREKKMIGLDCKIINGLYSYVVVRSMRGYEKKLASEIFQIAHCENVSNIKYVRMASKLASYTSYRYLRVVVGKLAMATNTVLKTKEMVSAKQGREREVSAF